MTIQFKVQGISKSIFEHYWSMDEEQLEENNAYIISADANPGYPCRVSLEDAEVGERILAVHFTHHDVNSPYRASGPIFIRENAKQTNLEAGVIPNVLKTRLLSLRGYNSDGLMLAAQTSQGETLVSDIQSIFSDKNIEYIHIHNANPGCFACSVIRV